MLSPAVLLAAGIALGGAACAPPAARRRRQPPWPRPTMNGPMISLRDAWLTYDDRPVLAGVDLDLDEGELVVVSGPTGAGKSTLLGVLAGLVPRFTGGELRGDLLLDGEGILHLPPRERVHAIGYVGQDPASGFVTDTVEEELAYGMEQLGLPPATMRRRVEETLDLLGIAELRARDLRTLSGGQQQRVAIGSVLAMHPRLLVLDEPTSALDPTAAEEVLATLARLVDDVGLAVLVAEHRLERVIPFADRMVLVPGDGSLRVGLPADVLATSPVVPPIIELGRGLGWTPLPVSVREARRRARRGGARRRRRPRRTRASATRCSSAAGLSVARGKRVVLREVDLTVRAGRVCAVMGRNGAGKSTLLWTLQGTRRRTTGRVAVAGADPAGLDPAARRSRIGLVPQDADDLLYLETVDEECAAADAGAEVAAGTCREVLDRLVPGIPGDRHPRDLSQGQRLALVLAIVLAGAPALVLLDEPTRGLDYTAKRALGGALAGLAEDGAAVVVATHDVEFGPGSPTRWWCSRTARSSPSGPVREVVVESPSFAPQVTKMLGPPWLRVDEVVDAAATTRALALAEPRAAGPRVSPRAPPRCSPRRRWPPG